MSLLGSAEFDSCLSDPPNLTAQVSAFTSPLLSMDDEEEAIGSSDLHINSFREGPDTDAGVIFTRSRSNANGTSSSSGSRFRGPPQWQTVFWNQ